MHLNRACVNILDQLSGMLRQLEIDDYSRPSTALGNVTIGQHLRHTLEFFLCLEKGFSKGVVNYDQRAHDKEMESDKFIALNVIERIKDFVNNTSDQTLKLEVGYALDSEACSVVETNYLRELTYNIEHAVHHMALMKIGLREVAPYVEIPADFGIAVSTMRYHTMSSVAH